MPLPVEPWSQLVRLAEAGRRPQAVALAPDADARAALADRLGISAIRKLRLEGTLEPEGRRDWRLEAVLGATVVQPCVATLAPVSTRIDETVVRRYLAEMPDPPAGDEVEMPADDTDEPLPAVLDLGAVMAEALALALPAYPRAPGVTTGDALAGPPGARPLTDEEARPLAGLRRLLDGDEGSGGARGDGGNGVARGNGGAGGSGDGGGTDDDNGTGGNEGTG